MKNWSFLHSFWLKNNIWDPLDTIYSWNSCCMIVHLIDLIKICCLILKRVGSYEGRPPTVPSLLSRDYVHHVVPNELWIPWKEFGLIAYCWWGIAFLRYFLIEGCGPPQEHEENWFSNFDLKLCTEIEPNGNSLLWKF